MNEDEMTGTRTDPWQSVYTTKTDDSVSWFEQSPNAPLELIKAAGIGSGSVIDIGGGASKLVDALVAKGHSDVAVLDLSAQALEIAKARLGSQADKIKWMIGDVTAWNPTQHYDLWHDRAAFHFLTTPNDQAAYAKALHIALDGPERCSGLPVSRYDSASIARGLGPDFSLFDERRYDHITPGGLVQKFQFSSFRKTA